MGVFGAIVEISALPMLSSGKQLTLRHAVASQFVGDDHPWLVLQSDQKPFEEALGGFGIASPLNQDIEDYAVLINGTPEIVLDALNPHEHFVQVPLIARS